MPNAQHDYIISSINCNNILLNNLYIKNNTQLNSHNTQICYNCANFLEKIDKCA